MMLTMISTLALARNVGQLQERAAPKQFAGPVGKEVVAVKELRSRVGHLIHSDYARGDSSLLRWLRAKKLDVDGAEKMVIKHLEWRKKLQMDKLRRSEPDPKMLSKFWYNMTGFDRQGNPVMLMTFGEWDIRTYLDSGGNLPEFDKHQGQMWEKALVAVEQAEKNPQRVRKSKSAVQYIMLCDLNKFEYRQMASYWSLQAILSMVYNFENNYPEVILYCYIINADWIFEALLGIIRPFMQGSIEKLKVYGKDRPKWERVVRRIVDPKLLPYRFGGFKDNHNLL